MPLRVEALFDLAAQTATNGRTTVEFDKTLGYPTRIAIGPDPAATGQRETIEVVDFAIP